MKLSKCSKGHYYDSEKYETCPLCDGKSPGYVSSSMEDRFYEDYETGKIKLNNPLEAVDSDLCVDAKVNAMFEIQLPDGFIQVKQLCFHKEYWMGFSHNIEMLSIIQNSEGTLFLRKYTNCCDAGANGRPCTSIRDVCYKLDGMAHISGINEKNWDEYITIDELLHPSVIVEDTGGTYVDQNALDFVKEDAR